MPPGTLANVQNLKKKKKDKVANQNENVNEQCKSAIKKRTQIDDWKKNKNKNKK